MKVVRPAPILRADRTWMGVDSPWTLRVVESRSRERVRHGASAREGVSERDEEDCKRRKSSSPEEGGWVGDLELVNDESMVSIAIVYSVSPMPFLPASRHEQAEKSDEQAGWGERERMSDDSTHSLVHGDGQCRLKCLSLFKYLQSGVRWERKQKRREERVTVTMTPAVQRQAKCSW